MNEGFEWQLQLYEKMGCKVDVNSIIYKQYRLENIAKNCLGKANRNYNVCVYTHTKTHIYSIT